MSHKQVMFDDAALQEMKRGVERLADAVKCTMGPAGRNVVIQKSFGNPQVTKDGVSVAREVAHPEPFASMGAKMVVEVAKKTNDKAGDGTTTATVLAQAIFNAGLRHVTAGGNAVQVQRGVNAAANIASEAIEGFSVKCKGKDDYRKVASVSANHDAAVGELIAEAISKVGPEGVVEVEERDGALRGPGHGQSFARRGRPVARSSGPASLRLGRPRSRCDTTSNEPVGALRPGGRRAR